MIKLVAVGKMKNRALDSLCTDYFERLSRYDKFELVLIKDSTVQRESERMLELISSSKLRTYVLSEEGKLFSSRHSFTSTSIPYESDITSRMHMSLFAAI